MRLLEHPGMPEANRATGIPCQLHTVRVVLEPGGDFASALFRAAADAGFASGAFVLEALPVAGLTYNLPSMFDGPEKAAWFAGPFTGDTAVIEAGRVTIGLKDSAPMYHCHAMWRVPDGTACGGHLLLDRMRLTAPAEATLHGAAGAVFEVRPDRETGFSIFKPAPQETAASEPNGARPGLLVRIGPNVDFVAALSALMEQHGIETAEILSGVGSFVGGESDDGQSVPEPITEALVTAGRLHAGSPSAARIEAIATDPAGVVRRGRLLPDVNAVGITFEAALAQIRRDL